MADYKEFENPWSADNSEWYGEEMDKWFDGEEFFQSQNQSNSNTSKALTETDENGWLNVRKTNGEIISIVKYARVKYQGYNQDKTREEFTLLDWPHSNVKASVSAISETQSPFKSIQYLEGGLIQFNRDNYKLKYGSSEWIHAASDPSDLIPKGIHNLWLPDYMHSYGIPYLGDADYATVWFRIGNESSDRYLHVGSVSAGCITVGERDTGGSQSDRKKWDGIYNYLIKRRIGNKFVGKIKVF